MRPQSSMSVVVATGRELQSLAITLVPFPLRWKHSRLVVVHEGWKSGGFGGEIAASATEAAFDWLGAPAARVGAPVTRVALGGSFGRHARCPWRAVCGPAG